MEKRFWNGNIPWVSAKTLTSSRVSTSDTFITNEGLERGSRLVKEGSILLLVRGSGLFKDIPIAIVEKPVAFNQDVKAIEVNRDVLDPWYFLYWLIGNKKLLYTKLEATGIGAGKFDINILKDLEINLPSLRLQQRIASIARCWDDKIALNRRMNQTLEQMSQTLFERYSKTEETVPLTELIELNPKLSLKKDTVCSYIEMKDLSESSASIGKTVPREFKSGSKFQNDDTLMARITPCLENGKTGYVDLLEEGEIGWGSTEFIVMRAKKGISPYYVYCLARDRAFREYAIRSMVGTSGRQRVQVEMLNSFASPKWKKEDMEAFHSFAHNAFQKIKANSKEIATLTKTRDTLLPKLMSGEIDVVQAQKDYEQVLS